MDGFSPEGMLYRRTIGMKLFTKLTVQLPVTNQSQAHLNPLVSTVNLFTYLMS